MGPGIRFPPLIFWRSLPVRKSCKVTTGQVDYFLAFIIMVATPIAPPLGAMAGKKVNTEFLQVILALLIVGTAIKIWTDIL